MKRIDRISTIIILSLFIISCATTGPMPPMEHESARPGGTVNQRGNAKQLVGNPIAVGSPLPSVELVEAETMTAVDLSKERGKVLLLSIVPSIDTKVCEAQTHYLGEEGDDLSNGVVRITISRDTPFAQKRFAEAAKLTDVRYLSDYKEGAFGRATGLLIDDLRLLARSVIVVDRNGIVQYIQVVPEITHLPDMETAFSVARKLAG